MESRAKVFALSWLLRYGDRPHPSAVALFLSFAGVALAGITGWLGASWWIGWASASTKELTSTRPTDCPAGQHAGSEPVRLT